MLSAGDTHTGATSHAAGYPDTLTTLTCGAAELQMWLSHYEPVPPGPEAAA